MNKYRESNSPDKGETLKSLHRTFITGINNFKATAPRDFLETLGLDYQTLHLGFNSGQFHHRKSEEFKAPYIDLGVLKQSDAPVREKGMVGYSCFGDYGIIFPIMNEAGEITNMYGYRFKLQTPIGEYLNDDGIYPAFPSKRTTRLFLTENVIDGASLIQADVMENRDALIALKDGELTDDIKRAIEKLPELVQVIPILREANEELTRQLKETTIASVNVALTPEGDSVNELWLKYGSDGMLQFIEQVEVDSLGVNFQQISDREFYYKGEEVTYQISGVLSQNTSYMELNFEIESVKDGDVLKEKFDLLNDIETQRKLYYWSGNKELNMAQMLLELKDIQTELEKVRRVQGKPEKERGFSTKQDRLAKQLLRSDTLFEDLNEQIGKAGIVGEEKSRLLLYLVASSYKFKYNLHAVIHGEDMTSASELAQKVGQLIPDIERYEIDITSSRTFRYYGNSKINDKLILIPDYSGITSSRAINDLKRLQAKGQIVSDTPKKTESGKVVTDRDTVYGHCSSIGACRNSKRYFEGEPRTVLVSMDNSSEQMERLMDYDCKMVAGQINTKAEEKARELLQYVIRNVHSLDVVNPHSVALMLPSNIKNARMLTMQLNSFVSLITLFNQHKRDKDNQGRVMTTKEDVQIGIELFLDALMLNIDELDAGTRRFFDQLKLLMMAGSEKEKTKLSSLEIQKALDVSKTNANKYLKELVECEYIKKEGHRNRGFKYVVTNWDELSSIKKLIQNKLGESGEPKEHGSPEAA